jgi:HK97 family phage prohead protease
MPKKQREKLRKITLIPVATVVKQETEDAGIVEHFFSVLGNIDHDKDRILPGAFSKTIADKGVGGIRVLDSHAFSSVTDALGSPLRIEEVGREGLPDKVKSDFPDATGGIKAETRFNLKTSKGHDAFQLLKAGDVKEWSFGFAIIKADFETVKAVRDSRGFTLDEDGDEMRIQNIREVELFEYSPVIWGANSATSTVDAKGADKIPDADEEVDDDAITSQLEEEESADDGNEASADLDLHGKAVEKWNTHKPLMTPELMKDTNLQALVQSLTVAFYVQFPDTEDRVLWVREVWDNHLVILAQKADGETFHRVGYHLDQDQTPIFSHEGEWVEITQVWEEVGKSSEKGSVEKDNHQGAADLPTPPNMDELFKQSIGESLTNHMMAVATLQLDEWCAQGLITAAQQIVLSATIGKTIGTLAVSIPPTVKSLLVPGAVVTADKRGSVITIGKEYTQADKPQEPNEEPEASQVEAEPSETTLTSPASDTLLSGKDALEKMRQIKKQIS